MSAWGSLGRAALALQRYAAGAAAVARAVNSWPAPPALRTTHRVLTQGNTSLVAGHSCFRRWCSSESSRSAPVRGPASSRRHSTKWTPEHDEQLRRLVAEHGPQWKLVSSVLPHPPKECVVRYRRVVDPRIHRAPWTPEEDAAIVRLYAELGPRWSEIARRLPPPPASPDGTAERSYRTDKQVLERFRQRLNPARAKRPWTYAEEQQLKAKVAEHGAGRWTEVARALHGRTDADCHLRWRRVVDPRLIKGPWQPEEDQQLRTLVAELGKRWGEIGRRMPNRSDLQCLQRWYKALDPTVRREPWSHAEDRALLQAVEARVERAAYDRASRRLVLTRPRVRHLWADIAHNVSELKGRSPPGCRTRFVVLMCQGARNR